MGLRQAVEKDIGKILADSTYGFGYPITITDPLGKTAAMTGLSTDISQVIDPDTGEIVSGRLASVALHVTALKAAGLDLPIGIVDAAVKPWLVTFDDINGQTYDFKVSQSNPDRAIGLVVCILEIYKK